MLLVTSKMLPKDWDSPEYLEKEQEAIEHIDSKYFFQKGEPTIEGRLFEIPKEDWERSRNTPRTPPVQMAYLVGLLEGTDGMYVPKSN